VKREAQHRQLLIGNGQGGQPLKPPPEVVAEEPRQPAEERRSRGVGDRIGCQSCEQAARVREDVGTFCGRLEHRDRVGRQVGPASISAGPGALEQHEAREITEALGDVHRRKPGYFRELIQADAGRVARLGSGRVIVHPPDHIGRPIGDPPTGFVRCAARRTRLAMKSEAGPNPRRRAGRGG
jgi:hypothetical protein